MLADVWVVDIEVYLSTVKLSKSSAKVKSEAAKLKSALAVKAVIESPRVAITTESIE